MWNLGWGVYVCVCVCVCVLCLLGKGDVGSSIAKKTPTWLLGLKSWAYGLDAGDSANSEYSDLRSD